jgi:Domain of unknown function (DUF6285)
VQYRPDAATLLGAVAAVLDDVLADVPPAKQHQVRVAAHLSRLVEREVRLGGSAAAAECAALAELLGLEVSDLAGVADGSERLATRLRELDNDDVDFDARAWEVLVEVTRRDLDIAKPGHTDWGGR